MTYLVAGLALFLGVHSVSIVAPGWRDGMFARLGEARWKGLYSLIALVGFVLLIWGYARARQETPVLYAPPLWARHLAATLMLPVFPLLLATYLPGRIKRVVRHPMLWAVMLWATAHLFANGTLADVLLFGGFLAWAVLDRLSFNWRQERAIRTAPVSGVNDVIAVVGGLGIYAVIVLWLHVLLIGVAPFPR